MNQRFGLEAAMIECQRLWDETRDLDVCIARFPQYETDLREHFALADLLRAVKIPPPREHRRQQGWHELGSLVAFGGTRHGPRALRYAGIAAGLVLGVMAIGAAGAATNTFEPPAPVSSFIAQIETIPEYIGVREAPIASPRPAQPTATATPALLPAQTLPVVVPQPAVSPVPATVPAPLVIPTLARPAAEAPQVVPSPTLQQPVIVTPVPDSNRRPAPTVTPPQQPIPTGPSAPPGNSGLPPGQSGRPPGQESGQPPPAPNNAPPPGNGNGNGSSNANPGGNSNAGGNGVGNGNGASNSNAGGNSNANPGANSNAGGGAGGAANSNAGGNATGAANSNAGGNATGAANSNAGSNGQPKKP